MKRGASLLLAEKNKLYEGRHDERSELSQPEVLTLAAACSSLLFTAVRLFTAHLNLQRSHFRRSRMKRGSTLLLHCSQTDLSGTLFSSGFRDFLSCVLFWLTYLHGSNTVKWTGNLETQEGQTKVRGKHWICGSKWVNCQVRYEVKWKSIRKE